MAKREDRVSPGEVEEVLNKLPRFLFRVWTSKSGGNARLNTTEAITPHAFLDQADVDSFYDTSCCTLARLANDHLSGVHSASVYSSWSQSLDFVLAVGGAGRHITILDVSKLGPSNIVLPTWKLAEVLKHSVDETYLYEYLAFGIIPGACYQAVPRNRIMECGTISHHFDPHSACTISSRVAELYGPDFQLAIATYMLALTCQSTNVDDPALLTALLAMLAHCPIPEDWKHDDRVVKACSMGNLYNETGRAAMLLEQLSRKATEQASSGQSGGPEQRNQLLSRELKNLHIDLIGWC